MRDAPVPRLSIRSAMSRRLAKRGALFVASAFFWGVAGVEVLALLLRNGHVDRELHRRIVDDA